MFFDQSCDAWCRQPPLRPFQFDPFALSPRRFGAGWKYIPQQVLQMLLCLFVRNDSELQSGRNFPNGLRGPFRFDAKKINSRRDQFIVQRGSQTATSDSLQVSFYMRLERDESLLQRATHGLGRLPSIHRPDRLFHLLLRQATLLSQRGESYARLSIQTTI